MPTVLSSLRPCLRNLKTPLLLSTRGGGGHAAKMDPYPSLYQWRKWKDTLHLYVCIGFFPMFCWASYQNIFVGRAELADIPEGYTPQYYEHFRHPMTRWYARHQSHPAVRWEAKLQILEEESERVILKRIEGQVKRVMSARNDYKAWYYYPFYGKEIRRIRDSYRRLDQYDGSPVRGTLEVEPLHDPRPGGKGYP